MPRPNTTGSRQFETNHGKLASPEIGNTGLLVIIVMMIMMMMMMMMMIRKPAMLSHASAVSTTKTQSISGSLSLTCLGEDKLKPGRWSLHEMDTEPDAPSAVVVRSQEISAVKAMCDANV